MDPEVLEALRRNSGLRLDQEGRFHFHARLVENDRVQAFFHRHLTIRGDGDVTLKVGQQWAYVACASVARFVDKIQPRGTKLMLRYRHRDIEELVEPLMGFGPDGRCYLWSKPDGSPALLTRGAHQALEPLLEEREGRIVVQLGEARRPLAELNEVPTPAAPWPLQDVH